METIFWVYFRTNDGRSDRREYFEEQKSLSEFHQWVEKMRLHVQDVQGGSPVIQNMGVLTQKKL